jgi:hypothetical protein
MLASARVSPRVAPLARSRMSKRGGPKPSPQQRGASVVRSATNTEEPGDEDFVLFNAMLSSGDIAGAVRTSAVEGTLTPKTLGAAYVVYEKCKSLDENAQVLKTLEGVILLITQTLQQLNATPSVRLIDELMTMDPLVEAPLVKLKITQAIEGDSLTKEDLQAAIDMMIDGMKEQDEAWEKHVATAVTTESKEKFTEIVAHANGRMEAKTRLAQLRNLAKE